MASGNGPQQFRKAIGALKDSTKVGIAIVNSEYKDLDVAIVKATNHDEVLPKPKHICTIFNAISASSPRADVAYCIHALAKRLVKTHTWTVALKILVVIHRGLREVDPTFSEDFTNYNFNKFHVLNLSHFKDDSSPNAWNYSAWVRNYSLYIEELLECSRRLNYDIQKHPPKSRKLDTPDLLEQLPILQQLLFRLLACQPMGASRYNFLIQYAVSIIASESVRLYVTITDGIVNLVDKFFEMQRHEAIRALEIYKKAGNQAERLSEFFEMCRTLQFGTQQQYVNIEKAPASFLTAMEEYVKDAPQTLMLPWKSDDNNVGTPKQICAPATPLAIENELDTDSEKSSNTAAASEDIQKNSDTTDNTNMPPLIDLLSSDDVSQNAPEPEDKNASALAILTDECIENTVNSDPTNLSSWELALVTYPSPNLVAPSRNTQGGGIDRSMLDSLYDVALAKPNLNEDYHEGKTTSNPFEEDNYTTKTFYALNSIEPQHCEQMDAAAQDDHFAQPQVHFMAGNDPANPFGNPFTDQGNSSHPSEIQSPNPSFI